MRIWGEPWSTRYALVVLVQMSAPLIISGVVFQIGTLVLPPFMPSSV